MMNVKTLALLLGAHAVSSFSGHMPLAARPSVRPIAACPDNADGESAMGLGRADALRALLALTLLPEAASARGRNTQVATMQRYRPRLEALASYYKTDLPALIDSADWKGLTTAAEADMSKGGKVGALFRGESAMNLWASSFSDAYPSEKTKELLTRTAAIGDAREQLYALARKGTGEGLGNTGGFFGIGGAKEEIPSNSALQKEAKLNMQKAMKAYNEYIDMSNDGMPLEIRPLTRL